MQPGVPFLAVAPLPDNPFQFPATALLRYSPDYLDSHPGEFLPRVYVPTQSPATTRDSVAVDRVGRRLGRLRATVIREFEQGSRVGERNGRGGGRGESIEPSAGYRGMFLALLGVVAYRECIVCWSGR